MCAGLGAWKEKEQELWAYIQGYVDCVQALYHRGIIRETEGLQWLDKI